MGIDEKTKQKLKQSAKRNKANSFWLALGGRKKQRPMKENT